MTDIVKSIGTGGDYTSTQAWEDAIPADLTAVSEKWIGEVKNEELTGAVNIDSHTTSSSFDIILRCQTGASFRDNANVQTNGLRYNASNGAALKNTSVDPGTYVLRVASTNHFKVQGLQFQSSSTNTGYSRHTVLLGTGTSVIMEFCIVEQLGGAASGDYFADAMVRATGAIVRNCLLIDRRSNAANAVWCGASSEWHFCTFVRPSNKSHASSKAFDTDTSSPIVKNSAIFGFATLDVGSGFSASSGNNCTDLASGPGSSNSTSKTYANQFEQTSDASAADFRIKTGADCKGAGTSDTTNGANDIAKTARPSGGDWDAGCWELVVAAGGTAGNRGIGGGICRGIGIGIR